MSETQTPIEAIKQRIDEVTDGDARLLAVPLTWEIPTGDDPTSNVRTHQLALEGEWKGHFMGPFKLTSDHFAQMAHHRQNLAIDIVVDYEHASLNPLSSKNPAAGWIEDLQVRDTDTGKALFGRIRWTDSAANHIRAREYRYLSPTIVFRTPDRVTGHDLGASLHSVALTNTPFLDELPEVRLNSLAASLTRSEDKPRIVRKQEQKRMDDKQQAAVALSLGLAVDASADELVRSVTSLRNKAAGVESIALAIGLKESAAATEVEKAVRALKEEVVSLRDMAQEAKEIRANAAVEKARQAGKVTAENEPTVRRWAIDSPDVFSEWEKTAPRVVELGLKVVPGSHTKSKDDVDGLVALMSESEVDSCRKLGMEPRIWAKANADDLVQRVGA